MDGKVSEGQENSTSSTSDASQVIDNVRRLFLSYKRRIRQYQPAQLAVLFLLLLGLIGGLIMVGQQLDIRRKALEGGPSLSFSVDQKVVEVGATGQVYTIFMDTNDFDVTAADIEVQFDPNVMQVTAIDASDGLPVTLASSITTNTAKITVAVPPSDPPAGFNGVGAVAILTFDAVAEGLTDVVFTGNTQVAAIGNAGDVLGSTTNGRVMVGTEVPGSAGISVSPSTSDITVGQSLNVDVNLSNATAISATTMQMIMPLNSGIEPVSFNLNPDLVNGPDWSFPTDVNGIVNTGTEYNINVAAINTSVEGHPASSLTIGTLVLQAGITTPGPVPLQFNMNETKVTEKATGSDVLTSASGGYYRGVDVVVPTPTFPPPTPTPPPPTPTPPPPTPTAAPTLPTPWSSQDVGSVNLAGSASYLSGTFTVSGDGRDIWGSSDQFHYVYQPLNGDGEIIARVLEVDNTHVNAKAGVMIRETLNADSKNAIMELRAQNGTAFQFRAGTGGVSDYFSGGDRFQPPYWVRLVRSGNNFIGYKSNDGTNWVEVGSIQVEMTIDASVGLAVTSINVFQLNISRFDNVTVTEGFPPPPTPTPTQPVGGDQLSVDFRLQGISDLRDGSQDAQIVIIDDGNIVANTTFLASTVDTTGLYNGTAFVGSLNDGTYDILLKTRSHLQRRFEDVLILFQNGPALVNLANYDELLSGDVNATNTLTIEDIAADLALYNDFSVPVSAGTPEDINDDGFITILDVALTLVNYTDFTVPGDE